MPSTSILLKRSLAKKLTDDAEYQRIVDLARANLTFSRSAVRGRAEHAYLDEWATALDDKQRLIEMAEDTSPRGMSLWQVGPFCGVWTPKERWDALRDEGALCDEDVQGEQKTA
jgi:hypothetical protein